MIFLLEQTIAARRLEDEAEDIKKSKSLYYSNEKTGQMKFVQIQLKET
jgi:hypothetical protein